MLYLFKTRDCLLPESFLELVFPEIFQTTTIFQTTFNSSSALGRYLKSLTKPECGPIDPFTRECRQGQNTVC